MPTPSWSLAQFNTRLERMGVIVDDFNESPLILAGDLKVKSPVCGSSRPCPRGGILMKWANRLDLCLLNRGRKSTCVRLQGKSIIDLTFNSRRVTQLVSS